MRQEVEVLRVSRCAIKPQGVTEESNQPCHLAPWDLVMLSLNYIQKGLLFTKPPHLAMETILEQLKDSLSRTLTHFPPLAGRLVTEKSTDPASYTVFLNCSDAPGAEFIYATADVMVADVTAPREVPHFLKSLFAFKEIINHDGHTMPLVAVQVTELLDGLFVGLSLNHVVGDGTSFWHFFNTWSEISSRKVGNVECISRPPTTKRWFPDHHGPIIKLPFSHHDEFIERYIPPPPLKEIMFHIPAHSIAQLKAKANSEFNTTKISSFQALSAMLWRSFTRARNFPAEQIVSCRLAIDNRSRIQPPLSKNYFGNCIQVVQGSSTVGELLANDLGWSAWLLYQAVSGHTDKKVRAFLEEWFNAPVIYSYGRLFDARCSSSMMMGSSPRFDVYGNDFGWGRPVAIRSGFGSKFDGKVSSYPGSEGGVDIEVCLPSHSMGALMKDEEFMEAVCFPKVQ